MRGLRLIVAVAAFATSGCATLPHADTARTLTRPAITPDTAATVIKHYNEVSSSADRHLSAELISGVQAGDLLRQTEAAYKISRVLKKPVARPAALAVGTIGAPDYGSYPMHFLASGNQQVGVWERSSAAASWKLTIAVPHASNAKLLDLKGVRAMAATDAHDAVESPALAASKLADYLTVGATSPYAKLFTVTPEVARLQKRLADSHAWAAGQKAEIIEMSDKFTVDAPPLAFRASSGEVLAFFSLEEAHVMRTPGTFESAWGGGDGTEAFSPVEQTYRNALTSSTLHQVLVVVPVEKGATIRVAGFTSQLVDAGGY